MPHIWIFDLGLAWQQVRTIKSFAFIVYTYVLIVHQFGIVIVAAVPKIFCLQHTMQWNEQLFIYVKQTVKDVAQCMGDSDDHCKHCWPQDEFVIVKSALKNTRFDEHHNYHFLLGVDSLSWQRNIRWWETVVAVLRSLVRNYRLHAVCHMSRLHSQSLFEASIFISQRCPRCMSHLDKQRTRPPIRLLKRLRLGVVMWDVILRPKQSCGGQLET